MHKKEVCAKAFLIFMVSFISTGIFAHNSLTHQEPAWSPVELKFIELSGRQKSYEKERIPVLETQNPMQLGQLTALRFLEWVDQNPNGVISLPTGKTPEYFIKFLTFYKKKWHDP